MSEKSRCSSRKFGEGMQQTLVKRGIYMALEEAASFSRALLNLAEHGLLVPVEKPTDGVNRKTRTDSDLVVQVQFEVGRTRRVVSALLLPHDLNRVVDALGTGDEYQQRPLCCLSE